MKPTRIAVTRGATVAGSDGRTQSKVEYTIEMALEDPGEIQVVKAEVEAIVNTWLAAFTMASSQGPAPKTAASTGVEDLVAEALIRATVMEGKVGRWLWSRDTLELKAALLDAGRKLIVEVDGKTWDVKLGDGQNEKDAFVSFWPRTSR